MTLKVSTATGTVSVGMAVLAMQQ